jgi:hypothetical protein
MMRIKLFVLLASSFFISPSFAYTTNTTPPVGCQKDNMPRVINPMVDYDIIATNIGKIDASTIFSGQQLVYSIAAHPANAKNIVTIDKSTGIINVKAEKKDKFDIVVQAKNGCGKAENKFNVLIDEEE